MSRRAGLLAPSTVRGDVIVAGAKGAGSAREVVPLRGAWLHAIRALSAGRPSDKLALDWPSRRIDADLPFGLAVVMVPVRGGSEHAWGALVSALQDASAQALDGADGIHLISATRSDGVGWIEVGVFALDGQGAALRAQLEQLVARSNAR